MLPLYFELDGTFPDHEANPLDPANLVDLQKHVVATGADIGLAFEATPTGVLWWTNSGIRSRRRR